MLIHKFNILKKEGLEGITVQTEKWEGHSSDYAAEMIAQVVKCMWYWSGANEVLLCNNEEK